MDRLTSTELVNNLIQELTPDAQTLLNYILTTKEQEVRAESKEEICQLRTSLDLKQRNLNASLEEFEEQQLEIQNLQDKLKISEDKVTALEWKVKSVKSDEVHHLDLSGEPDSDYDTQDLMKSTQFCHTKEDHKVSLVLIQAQEIIDANRVILDALEDLTDTPGRELANLFKKCDNEKRKMEMATLTSKLLETSSKGSEELKSMTSWAYKTLVCQRTRLSKAIQILQDEIKTRNINIDKPDEDKTKFLTTPTFTGTTSATEPHFYEYWEQIEDYIAALGMSTEMSPMIVKASLKGDAKTKVDREFGSKVLPSLSEIESFLKEEYGNVEQLLQRLMKCHSDVGILNKDLSLDILQSRAETHFTLYNKAVLLEKIRPGITLDSYSYSVRLTEIFPQETIFDINEKKFRTTSEKISTLVSKIESTINAAKELKNYSIQPTCNPPQEEEEGENNSDESSDEYHSDEDENQAFPSYHTELNPPSPLVKKDTEGKCSLCYHAPNFKGGDSAGMHHKFSLRGNIEVDACPKLALLNLHEKEKLLTSVKYCKTCLYRKEHGECKLPPELTHLLCSFPPCQTRWAVCSLHMEDNRQKLERRKLDLATHGITWIY